MSFEQPLGGSLVQLCRKTPAKKLDGRLHDFTPSHGVLPPVPRETAADPAFVRAAVSTSFLTVRGNRARLAKVDATSPNRFQVPEVSAPFDMPSGSFSMVSTTMEAADVASITRG